MRTYKRFTGWLVLAFVISMMLPDNWYEFYHFGEIPLGVVVLACLCLAIAAHLLRHSSALSPWLLGGAGALVFMCLNGYLRGNIAAFSVKFFVADVYCFAALLAGYAFSCTRGRDDTSRMVSRMAGIAGAVIVITYIALFLGLISTEFNIEGRTVTASVFAAVGLLSLLLPWASVTHRSQPWRTGFLFAAAIGTSLISATRSLIILVGLGTCFYLILRRRQLKAAFFFRLSGAFLLLVVLLFSGWSPFNTFLFQRLNDTQLAEESRYEELSLWWPQVRGDIALGQGMGSRFVSNIVVDGNPLASATHVGILTFLMKGGAIVFLACAVLPLVVAVYVLFSMKFPERQRGAAASVLMFIGIACLSGGWFPLSLFAYGMAIASMLPESRRMSSAGMHVFRWSPAAGKELEAATPFVKS